MVISPELEPDFDFPVVSDPVLAACVSEFAARLPMYRDPSIAYGKCSTITHLFCDLLELNGIAAFHLTDHPNNLNLADRLLEAYGDNGEPFGTHTVCFVPHPEGSFLIDWTAAQYGYDWFPMVQLLMPDGRVLREWTAEEALDSVVDSTAPMTREIVGVVALPLYR